MGLVLEYKKHLLNFKSDAGTSRGVLTTKEAWIIKVYNAGQPSVYGLGEVSVIDRLSFDFQLDFEKELLLLAARIVDYHCPNNENDIYQLVHQLISISHPSIRFGLETALLDLKHGGKFQIFENDFYYSKINIPINGLIWMGDYDCMNKQIHQKLEAGYSCIKMKIGAINFDEECKVLANIRSHFPADQLILRVDANGAFHTQEVLKKLDRLKAFDLHSIEQPIMPRQTHAMQLVCKKSPIPVALDEELIGRFDLVKQKKLLQDISPNFIILKPALLGGFVATAQWIALAESMGIGWWITSALESNIGLNAICQFAAQYRITNHQGLGTGQLYRNNFHSPVQIKGEYVYYNSNLSWDYSALNF